MLCLVITIVIKLILKENTENILTKLEFSNKIMLEIYLLIDSTGSTETLMNDIINHLSKLSKL